MDNSVDNEAGRIALTGGRVALVSPADLERLEALSWHLHGGNARRRSVYACHAYWSAGRARHVPMHHHVLAPVAGLEVDHANGDSLDNRRENLRHLTHRVNVRRAMRRLDRMHSRLR